MDLIVQSSSIADCAYVTNMYLILRVATDSTATSTMNTHLLPLLLPLATSARSDRM
jgi:hypothetical protein